MGLRVDRMTPVETEGLRGCIGILPDVAEQLGILPGKVQLTAVTVSDPVGGVT